MSGWGVFLRAGLDADGLPRVALVKERGAIWMGSEDDAKQKAAEYNTKATNPEHRYVALRYADVGM